MDTSLNQKLKRRKSEHTLEKYHQDRRIDGSSVNTNKTVQYGDKRYQLSPDFDDLPECDFENPEYQKWLHERDRARAKKYGRLSLEEFESIVKVKDVLLKTKPSLTRKQAFDFAWEKVMNRKLPIDAA